MQENQNNRDESQMLSIWFFVSLVLAAYGPIVLGAGIYYEIHPVAQTGELAVLNPSLLWGGIMIAAAGVLFLLDRKAR